MKILKNAIKGMFLFSLVAFTTSTVDAQNARKSPAMEATGKVGDAEVTVKYGAPYVKGRTIFGELEKWDKVWRTGANEATTFEVSADVLIEGEKLPAGKYALFTIPNQEKWTVIFNSVHDQWGAYDYSEDKDVLRVEVKPHALDEIAEQLTFKVKEKDGSSYVYLKWDHTKVAFSIASAAASN